MRVWEFEEEKEKVGRGPWSACRMIKDDAIHICSAFATNFECEWKRSNIARSSRRLLLVSFSYTLWVRIPVHSDFLLPSDVSKDREMINLHSN